MAGYPPILRTVRRKFAGSAIGYVPASRAVNFRTLRPQTTYRLTLLNPVTGQRAASDEIIASPDGQTPIAAPPHGHDWAVLLEW